MTLTHFTAPQAKKNHQIMLDLSVSQLKIRVFGYFKIRNSGYFELCTSTFVLVQSTIVQSTKYTVLWVFWAEYKVQVQSTLCFSEQYKSTVQKYWVQKYCTDYPHFCCQYVKYYDVIAERKRKTPKLFVVK